MRPLEPGEVVEKKESRLSRRLVGANLVSVRSDVSCGSPSWTRVTGCP